MVNMVASVDGRAASGGKASRIGSDVDRRAMRNLRANSDAVMVGANTLRAERLSLGLDRAPGGAQPLGVVLSTDGDVPLETNLVSHDGQTVLVIAGPGIPEKRVEGLGARAKVLRVAANSSGRPDLPETLRVLRQGHGVELLLVEGGPTLNRALISDDLVDEIFLTISPKLLFGDETTILGSGVTPEQHRDLSLVSVHSAGDELFLRYAVKQHPRATIPRP